MVDASVRDRLAELGTLLPRQVGRRPKVEPVAEAWLAALTRPDSRFQADADGLLVLKEALSPWDEVGSDDVGPARATFRLAEAPEIDPDTDEPSTSDWRRVPIAVHHRPQPADPRRAGLEDRLQRWVERPQN